MKKSILAQLDPHLLKKVKKIPEPEFITPMLATLTTDYFSSTDWIYEHKFDGVRCIVVKKKGKIHLLSRNRRLMNNEYPELVKALLAQKADNFIVDGEIVATYKGLSDFELLQSRINLKDLAQIEKRVKTIPIAFRIFDIMYAYGYDLRDLPLLTRKKILKKLLNYTSVLSYTEHKSGNGIAYFKKACRLKWEGLIAKKDDSIYESRRSLQWLKFKCIMQQELVIGGYTNPKGARTDFGALLVGYYAPGGKFKFAGKVGTGYSQDILRMLGKKLRPLKMSQCPFDNYNRSSTGVNWVKPQLVAEFKFAEWTRDNKLRVGRYKGLRTDKSAKLVVKETPKSRAQIKKQST